MEVVNLRGLELEPAVVLLLATAQTHVRERDRLSMACSMVEEYARSDQLKLWGWGSEDAFLALVGIEETGPGKAVVRDLAVAPHARCHGFGRALIDYLRYELGYKELEGYTEPTAVPFFERCGFNITTDRLMPDGPERFRFSWRSS